MNPLDLMLIKAIASSPDEVMRQLLSPQTGWEEGWVETPTVKNICRQMARMAMAGQSISWLSLISTVTLDDTSLDTIKQAWREGKAEKPDWRPVISEMKLDFMRRMADNSIESYHGNVNRAPAKVSQHLGTLGVELSDIARGGEVYDPTPFEENYICVPRWSGSWGDTCFDDFLGGGVPSFGSYALLVSPSGFGKTTVVASLSALSIYRGEPAIIISNELTKVQHRGRVFNAYTSLCREHKNDMSPEQARRNINEYLKIYEEIYEFERAAMIMNWHRPSVAFIDSLDALNYPKTTERFRDSEEKHKARANGIREMALRCNSFILVPSNASGDYEGKLREGVDKVTHAKAFGSNWYHARSDWSGVMTRDKTYPHINVLKRTKDRENGDIGARWNFRFNDGMYFGIGRV